MIEPEDYVLEVLSHEELEKRFEATTDVNLRHAYKTAAFFLSSAKFWEKETDKARQDNARLAEAGLDTTKLARRGDNRFTGRGKMSEQELQEIEAQYKGRNANIARLAEELRRSWAKNDAQRDIIEFLRESIRNLERRG